MASPPRALVPKRGKPTHSHFEKAVRKPFWVFAPNEPIFRSRSIRRVAVSTLILPPSTSLALHQDTVPVEFRGPTAFLGNPFRKDDLPIIPGFSSLPRFAEQCGRLNNEVVTRHRRVFAFSL